MWWIVGIVAFLLIGPLVYNMYCAYLDWLDGN